LDLPTYTNIWRIEKRLYKLYDFRLPMPIPVGQIAVFSAIAVPYVLALKMVGLPFSHTLLWIYILPPGALAWLVTRPVLEGKRLPELVVSQVRYLNEPRTWCRMAPLAERAEVLVVARVWRRAGNGPVIVSPPAAAPETGAAGSAIEVASVPEPAIREPAVPEPAVRGPAVPEPAAQGPAVVAPVVVAPAAETACGRPALERHLPTGPVAPWPEPAAAAASPVSEAAGGAAARPAPAPPPSETPEAPARPAADAAQTVPKDVPPAAPAAPPRSRPLVTVTEDQPGERPIRMVERALGNPSQRRIPGWRDRVVVVPGGHRPGQPDQLQRDRARARVPLPAGRRVVVLGCTVGAGQTVTALMAGELLASLRDEQVAVLDLNPGDGCLAQRAQAVPSLTGSAPPAPSRLEVVTRENPGGGDGTDGEDVTRIFELLSARYPLTLADPGAAVVPRVLAAAAQLILVAPASQDAAAALATTREWLEAHDYTELADGAITVLNGVSGHTMPYVEQAEALARGRCRAIVRVPWDDGLKNQEHERLTSSAQAGKAAPGPVARSLSPAALHAYTALAGVLVTALASGAPEQLRARP
jgi:MinD-like ATPase involved in chromosome partitioning or flagellar assembly